MLEPEKQLENPQEKPSFQGSTVQHSFSEVFFGSSFKAFQCLTWMWWPLFQQHFLDLHFTMPHWKAWAVQGLSELCALAERICRLRELDYHVAVLKICCVGWYTMVYHGIPLSHLGSFRYGLLTLWILCNINIKSGQRHKNSAWIPGILEAVPSFGVADRRSGWRRRENGGPGFSAQQKWKFVTNETPWNLGAKDYYKPLWTRCLWWFEIYTIG